MFRMIERVRARVRELHPRLVEQRRDFHRHPELGFQEVRTARVVADWLKGLGLQVETGVAKTGVVARLCGGRPGKRLALRADLDALPIQDVKPCEYQSTVPGVMHACGHDAHTAMLLGAATVLSELREEIPGEVVFLFQPAEEGPGGACPMIEAGVLEGVDLLLAQHVVPSLPAGYASVMPGAVMASTDDFTLKIIGKGGHGGYPHTTVDPIPIAAQVITALQAVVARQVDPNQPAVLTIASIHGGQGFNVIAPAVEMTGTVRTFDQSVREEILHKMEAILQGITSGYGATYELVFWNHYPPLINNGYAVDLMRRVMAEAIGREKMIETPPTMGGDDLAHFLRHVPGCYFWLGCRHPNPVVPGYTLHHPGFDLDEESLYTGTLLLTMGALTYLRENEPRSEKRSV
jgi:amidohydrolase